MNQECVICKNDITQFNCKTLNCGHYFHSDCINQWIHTFQYNNQLILHYKCPLCRYECLKLKEKYSFNNYIHLHLNLLILFILLYFIKMIIY